MKFALFSVLTTFFLGLQETIQVDTTEAFKQCFSNQMFDDFIAYKVIHQEVDTLIVCDNKFISAKDGILFRGEPLIFQSLELIFAETKEKIVLQIQNVEIKGDEIVISFVLKEYFFDSEIPNVLNILYSFFKVNMKRFDGTWSLVSIE